MKEQAQCPERTVLFFFAKNLIVFKKGIALSLEYVYIEITKTIK